MFVKPPYVRSEVLTPNRTAVMEALCADLEFFGRKHVLHERSSLFYRTLAAKQGPLWDWIFYSS